MIFKTIDDKIGIMECFLFGDDGYFLSDPLLDCINLLLFLSKVFDT